MIRGLHQKLDLPDNTVTLADLKRQFGNDFQPPKVNRDFTINPGTIGLWDFNTTYGAPGATAPDYDPVSLLPQGLQINNLVTGGAPATTTDNYGPKTYENGGILLPGTGFGASVKLADVTWKAGLMLTAWFKGSGVANVGFNARFMGVGPMYVVPRGDAGGQAGNFEVVAPNFDVPVDAYSDFGASLRSVMSDGLVHQVAIQSEDMGGGNHRVVVYLDRVRVFVGNTVANTAPGVGEAYIGARGGAGGVPGPWYRARLDDTTQSGLTGYEIIRQDYDRNHGRLSALI